jgi:hypothetical protein
MRDPSQEGVHDRLTVTMHFPALCQEHPHLVDMPVIVRHQDRGALRLDHRHDQALCRRRAVIWSLITGIMPRTGSSSAADRVGPWLCHVVSWQP